MRERGPPRSWRRARSRIDALAAAAPRAPADSAATCSRVGSAAGSSAGGELREGARRPGDRGAARRIPVELGDALRAALRGGPSRCPASRARAAAPRRIASRARSRAPARGRGRRASGRTRGSRAPSAGSEAPRIRISPGDAAPPQGDPFLRIATREEAGALGFQPAGDRHGPVPVGVRLEDGIDLAPRRALLRTPVVARDRVEVDDGPGGPRAASRSRQADASLRRLPQTRRTPGRLPGPPRSGAAPPA